MGFAPQPFLVMFLQSESLSDQNFTYSECLPTILSNYVKMKEIQQDGIFNQTFLNFTY